MSMDTSSLLRRQKRKVLPRRDSFWRFLGLPRTIPLVVCLIVRSVSSALGQGLIDFANYHPRKSHHHVLLGIHHQRGKIVSIGSACGSVVKPVISRAVSRGNRPT